MGKSAGKWIKTILFGKKHTKSKHAASDKKTPVKDPLEDSAANAPLISDPIQLRERGTDSFELEDSSLSPRDETASTLGNQVVDSPSYVASVQVTDAEFVRQQRAATTAQSAFRGYLARRAFRALKGIIRLQALIRGHLVRRQAVVTFRCMRAIVQLQTFARGRKDANSVDNGPNSLLHFEKLATNAFVRKLITSVPSALPLALQYEPSEPNSASNWLERWSISRFWASQVRTKRNTKPKHPRKQSTDEVEPVKSVRTIRKAATNGNHVASSSFEGVDKLKSNPRMITSSNQTDSAPQDQAQTEIERVKRSLRKVSSASTASEKAEALPPKKAQQIQSVETAATQLEAVVSLENPSNSTEVNEPAITSFEAPPETHSPVENGSEVVEEECSNVDSSGRKEIEKTRKRNSLPAKQEYAENISQNSPSLPSYMAATKSAKAKLRSQGSSSNVIDDGVEKGYVRRHSLPAPTSGKLSSLSPRVQKPTQATCNGRRGNRTVTNPSLTASRDDKIVQPGWRR